ncbi:hypothetical protein CRG98_040279 [Punica granatum]|uniref:Uncharacterized protein n=1 Tax=Punica granatum TaxID=22663 RepID=A0A2I0I5T4_PUNGR|nr:hypothetical protein CRG98_040279 [Punica granatum]
MGRANETRPRTGCPFSFIFLGVSNSLSPRVSVNHGMTIIPLEDKIATFIYKLEIASHEGVQEGLARLDSSRLKSGPDSTSFTVGLRGVCGNYVASRKEEPEGFGHTKEPHGPYCKGGGRGFLGMAEPS